MYLGSEWLKRNILKDTGVELSSLGADVADLLGDVWMGIYHMEDSLLAKGEWDNNHHIRVSIRGGLATVDGNKLTRLVVLVHDRMLRMEVHGSTHGYLKLVFHRRKSRIGQTWERCPELDDHVRDIRLHYVDRGLRRGVDDDVCE